MSAFLIYFMKPIGMAGPIKIGCSKVPANRLLSLAVFSPFPLELLATAPGSFKLETNVHACFANLHLHHEWFSPGDSLVKAIARIASGEPLEAAIDLTARVGKIRAKANRKPFPPSRRLYLSYSHRFSWAQKRLSKGEGAFPNHGLAPDDADAILHRWSRQPDPAAMPPAEDIARLDEILADPARHFVDRDVKYPPSELAVAA